MRAGTQRPVIGMSALGAVSALGAGYEAHVTGMQTLVTGLTPSTDPRIDFDCCVGAVPGLNDLAFPTHLAAYDNRASRIVLAGLEADGFRAQAERAIARWGRERVGLVLGTSTSGVERLEDVYRARAPGTALAADYSLRHHNDHHALTGFVSELLGIGGPAYTVSTACSSSAKAIVDAWQMIATGIADAVIAGGADSLCLTSLYGFESLQLVSRQPCRPMSASRDGLSIGEGAGFLLLERDAEGARLSGYGESSDATSMSTPPSDGAGAATSMKRAIEMADLAPGDISFVKLHGTATPTNDVVEIAALDAVLPGDVPAASLKGLIGHTLGAAGSLETVMSLYAAQAGILPGNAGLATPEDGISTRTGTATRPGALRHVLCNAFGFGGSNSSLVVSIA